ncbi:MAG TPA: response regulator transcription factor [Gallionella sp.]|nr:response regulator transcription factor [Gallionella sp.]
MIRVLIADDHVIMRNGLKQLCEDMGDIEVAGEAKNSDEVLALLNGGKKIDLALLDLTMPGVSGADLVERIRERDANLPILIFSMRSELQVAKAVLKAGANGYITKGGEEALLISAIRKVAKGERFVDPIIVEQSMFAIKAPREPALGRLTEREVQVMKLTAQGKTLAEIAAELFISIKTVSAHKKNLMLKMNFNSTAELAIYAAENGLNKA